MDILLIQMLKAIEGRAIPFLKKLFGHSLHWNICLLHGNQLPFQALKRSIWWEDCRPNFFPIGAKERHYQAPNPSIFPHTKWQFSPADLSHEHQQYIHDICHAICNVSINLALFSMPPGSQEPTKLCSAMPPRTSCIAPWKQLHLPSSSSMHHVGSTSYFTHWAH